MQCLRKQTNIQRLAHARDAIFFPLVFIIIILTSDLFCINVRKLSSCSNQPNVYKPALIL